MTGAQSRALCGLLYQTGLRGSHDTGLSWHRWRKSGKALTKPQLPGPESSLSPMMDTPYLLFLNSYYISLDSPLKLLPLLSSDVRKNLYRGFVIKYSIILARQIQRREH
jgi:hypothetical protein